MRKHVFTVLEHEAGLTLLELLRGRLPGCCHGLEEWISGGSVYIAGRRTLAPGVVMRSGQRVMVLPPVQQSSRQPPSLALAFRDADVAVVDKPAGQPSTPSRRGGELSLEDQCRAELGDEARLMHRLDRGTSGLLLVSLRGGRTRQELARQIAEHCVQRRYLALVSGAPSGDSLSLSSRLAVERGRTRTTLDPRGHEALTRAMVLRRGAGWALLQVEIHSGRSHQIRAHLSEAGCALLGDPQYGGPEAARLCLHAHNLRYRHPASGTMDIHSPLPPEFRQVLHALLHTGPAGAQRR